MGSWKYVFLAYGIVWFALLFYFFLLKRRVRKVEVELSNLRSSGDHQKNA